MTIGMVSADLTCSDTNPIVIEDRGILTISGLSASPGTEMSIKISLRVPDVLTPGTTILR